MIIVGVSEEEQKTIQIYPNPTSSDLYIDLMKGSGQAELKLFDSSGREVIVKSLPEGKTVIELDHVSAGIYLLKTYRHGKEVSASRIVVR